jgi:hypothetical protein
MKKRGRMNSRYLMIVIFLAGCSSTWCPCTETGALRLGMDREEVRQACGEPQNVNRSMTYGNYREQWVYYYFDIWLGYRPDIAMVFLYFDNGKLTGWQD